VKHLNGKTIRILDSDCGLVGPDCGQLFIVRSVNVEEEGTEHEHFEVVLDVETYEAHNLPFMIANWYDDNHVPCLTWKESGSYPKNGLESVYLSSDSEGTAFEVVEHAIPLEFPVTAGWYWMTERFGTTDGNTPECRMSPVIGEKRDGEDVVRLPNNRRMDLSNAKSWKAHFLKVNDNPIFPEVI
jgi:hypothetical protein